METVAIHNEIMTNNTSSDPIEYSSIETSMSQMSLLECPVCDEQFDAPTVLESHIFEHSTCIDDHDNTNCKLGISFDDSSSSYTDLVDEPFITPFECKKCTVTFATNASLNMHKKMSKIIIVLSID